MEVLKSLIALFCVCVSARAEVLRLTLRQAVGQALQQNPDVILARLDEEKARDQIRIAKDPFVPKVYGGSGLAYTYGYPNSIEGNAPAIFEARTNMSLYNRPKSYELAQARENARGAELSTQAKAEDIAFQTATLFLDTLQLARSRQSLRAELESFENVREYVIARVNEGREIPLQGKRADLDLGRARQRLQALESDLDYSETSLAVILGYSAADRVEPVNDETLTPEVPERQETAISTALQNSRQVRQLESQLQAKNLEIRGYESYRYPQIDLVAQYALFSKQNFQAYFPKFQANNGQLGVSVQIPLLVGSAAKGYLSQANEDLAKIRTEINSARTHIALETQKAYDDLQKAEAAAEVARLDLEVAREQVSVLLAQLTEGRVPQQSVEQARLTEQEKWISFYEAQHATARARMEILHETGTLVAALR